MTRKYSPRKNVMNPLGYHLLNLMRDARKRLIILYGGSSSGKTYAIAQTILMMTVAERQNTIVMRKVGASISKTIYEDFKEAARQLGIYSQFRFKDSLHQIMHSSGAKIDFTGLDDPEKIKGIANYKRVVMDEWSEFDLEDFKQIRKRLRGREGQQIITAFNPIKETHWIKREVFDIEKWHDMDMELVIDGCRIPPKYTRVKSLRINSEKTLVNPRTGREETHPADTVAIQTTYLNNFWVVGSPDGTFGYYDRQCIADFEKDRLHDPDYYNVYALGEWGILRTGSEFFGSFNRGRHVGQVEYNPELPIHISVDSNVLPYITVTYWQIDTRDGSHIRQIAETCAESPDNTVRRSAKLVAQKLRGYGVDSVFLHGDASTRAANNIDDEKRSFLDLFIDTLHGEGVEVTDCVGTKNPSVPMSGEFINAIFDGIFDDLSISISESCNVSVEDYLSVQKDVNGSILKTRVKNKLTGQSYEEHGHCSDTARYLITDVLKERFYAFSNRRKRNIYAKDDFIKFFNPDVQRTEKENILYVIPNIEGKAVFVHGFLCGKKWHIVKALIDESQSVGRLGEIIRESGAMEVVVECQESYFSFVRQLREEMENIKAKRLSSDLARRISATSYIVGEMLRFDPDMLDNDARYSEFVGSLLDFDGGNKGIEAGAAISGFIEYAVRWMQTRELM